MAIFRENAQLALHANTNDASRSPINARALLKRQEFGLVAGTETFCARLKGAENAHSLQSAANDSRTHFHRTQS